LSIKSGWLVDILPLLGEEIALGLVFLFLGFTLFRYFEMQAKRKGTLEIF